MPSPLAPPGRRVPVWNFRDVRDPRFGFTRQTDWLRQVDEEEALLYPGPPEITGRLALGVSIAVPILTKLIVWTP